MRVGMRRPNIPKKHAALYAALFFFVAAMFVLWYEGASRPYIDDDFSYSANYASSDRFYDAESQTYQGERYAKSTLFYQADDSKNDSVTVRSVFKSVGIDGSTIATITRERQADSNSGVYIPYEGEAGSSGDEYIFAPRNLHAGDAFTTRYPVYDVPAHMQFVAEEEVLGLRVFRYETDYSDVGRIERSDVTDGTPSGEYGIAYAPHLTWWVEPETGWLIRVEDTTVIQAYSRQTGDILRPLNTYTSRFTDESVQQHVEYVKSLKYRIQFAKRTVPGFALVVALGALLVYVLMKLKKITGHTLFQMGVVVAGSLFALLGWTFRIPDITTFYTGSAAVNPLTSLLFMTAAVVLVMLSRGVRSIPLFAIACIAFAVSFVQLLGVINAISFKADLVLFGDLVVEFSRDVPSHMSMFTAMVFMLLFAGIVKIARSEAHTCRRFAVYCGGMTCALGLVGFVIQFLNVGQLLRVPLVYSLSLPTALLLSICGFTLVRVSCGARTLRETGSEIRWPVFAVVPLVAIAAIAQTQQNTVQIKLERDFDEQISQIESAIDAQTRVEANLLEGAAALLSVSDGLTNDTWIRYMDVVGITENYPEILGVGYQQFVDGDMLDEHLRQVRASGFSDYAITPEGQRRDYTPIQYIAPYNARNKRLIGFDMYSEPIRREAIDRTRDSGSVSISGKISLPPSLGLKNDVTFIMLAPVHDPLLPRDTVEQRSAATRGTVGATYNTEEFMDLIFEDISPDINIDIYDGLKADGGARLYSRYDVFDSVRLQRTKVVYVLNHPWTVVFSASESFTLSGTEERLPLVVLIGGTVLYFVALSVAYALYAARYREGLRVASKELKRTTTHHKQTKVQ